MILDIGGGFESMKKERENTIIQFLLKKNNWVKADILASQFSISSRSIRNYVNKINESTSPNILIMSSNLGYKINETVYDEIKRSEHVNNTAPQAPNERLHYLLKQA
ncbi:HTH domain-containing protein, partial [Agrobacterium tumefaciens]|uniref:HTH domain-containing protein n=1 Tax=Agrobacterium tumefaciens TaxID=358 RepID=UPI001CBD2E36